MRHNYELAEPTPFGDQNPNYNLKPNPHNPIPTSWFLQMMRVTIRTKVNGNYLEVMSRFDRQLFEYLLPKSGGIELLEFTGSETGGRVHLQFTKPLKGTWISDIIDHGVNDSEAWFLDKGTTLPFGLKFWEHRHAVERDTDDSCVIVDDIEYRFGNGLLTTLLYPFVYLGFLPRRKQYKEYFNQ